MKFSKTVQTGEMGIEAYQINDQNLILFLPEGSLWLIKVEAKWSIAKTTREPLIPEDKKGFLIVDHQELSELETALGDSEVKKKDAFILTKR